MPELIFLIVAYVVLSLVVKGLRALFHPRPIRRNRIKTTYYVPGAVVPTFHNDAADYERILMTPKLRYEILRRDNFRCTICGRGQSDGVKLHVDHIKPVSKGGQTVPHNLRTLCQDCNLGKGDSYIENGIN